MAFDNAVYFVSRDIAIRSGLIQERYRIADGRFVLNNKDLSYVRFTPDEYIDGLKGVERTSDEIAARLIAENGYQMGDDVTVQEEQQQEQENDKTEQSETETDTNTETVESESNNGNTDGDVANVEDVLEDLTNNEENNETTEG